MFDRIHLYDPRPAHVTVTSHVTEQRAPTDESIKLYGEMLDKARAEIVTSALNHIPANVLSHVKLGVRHQMLEDQLVTKIAFRLNGKDHVVEVENDRDERYAMARAIVEKLLEHVGAELWKSLPR